MVFFVYTGAEITSGNWAYTLFTQGRGIAETTAAFWTSVYWGSFTLGRMTLGMVIDHFGVVPVLRICMLGCVAGAGLLWWAPLPWLGFLGLALLGWCFAPIFPTLVSNTPELLGKEHGPNAIGLQIGTAGLGYAALPGVMGLMARNLGIETLGPYLLAVCLLMLGLYEVLVRLKPRPKPR
jgi:fucose permease